MEDLRPEDPRQMGDYRLLARIGAGGMGQVFLGQSQGGRPLAIKVIRPDLAGDRGFRKRFSQEVASARAVNGLYTALVVDADADGPAPWLATAYVPGLSLAEAVEEHGPLPVESVQTLAAGLAESLKAIHGAGIVHRDLKPSNVLLAEDGPRVIDFGIARALESASLTTSGVIVGTVAFMSPEQVQGGSVGPPSDIFSLGAVLVFAATGEGPFGTGTPTAMLYRVVHNAPDTSRVPDQLRSLIDRCLARDPSDRPGTGELLAELQTARPALNWLPSRLTRNPTQERYDTAYQKTETARPAPSRRGSGQPAQARSRQRHEDAEGSESARIKAEATELYKDLERISTAPELAKRLSNLAAQAGRSGYEMSTWPTTAVPADISAVRAGHVIPHRDLLDAFLASCGVRAEHMELWHSTLDRVDAATGGIIELRARAIELARDLDLEYEAYLRSFRHHHPWTAALFERREQRHAPSQLDRARTYGRLRGLARAVADEADRISRLSGRLADRHIGEVTVNLREMSVHHNDSWLFNPGIKYARDVVQALAAVQVDASGVDLSNRNLHEPDAARDVVWTEYTKWPADVADAIRKRSREIRPGTFQVT